jgi:hypothetical protein
MYQSELVLGVGLAFRVFGDPLGKLLDLDLDFDLDFDLDLELDLVLDFLAFGILLASV